MAELKMPYEPSIKGHTGSLRAKEVTLISPWSTCSPSSFACTLANPHWIWWSPLRRRPVCDGKEPQLLKAPRSTWWEVLFLKRAVRVHAIRQRAWLRHSGRRRTAHYALGGWPTSMHPHKNTGPAWLEGIFMAGPGSLRTGLKTETGQFSKWES